MLTLFVKDVQCFQCNNINKNVRIKHTNKTKSINRMQYAIALYINGTIFRTSKQGYIDSKDYFVKVDLFTVKHFSIQYIQCISYSVQQCNAHAISTMHSM